MRKEAQNIIPQLESGLVREREIKFLAPVDRYKTPTLPGLRPVAPGSFPASAPISIGSQGQYHAQKTWLGLDVPRLVTAVCVGLSVVGFPILVASLIASSWVAIPALIVTVAAGIVGSYTERM